MKDYNYRLLASSSDIERLRESIAKFWFTTKENIGLRLTHKNIWLVGKSIPDGILVGNLKVVEGFRVIKKGKRYRFEGRV